ncbi:hypothetical protein GCM10027589_08780 [Actinocorallia lasiicapitis]
MPALRDARAEDGLGGEDVPFDEGDFFEVLGEHTRGQQTGDAPSDHYGVFPLHIRPFTGTHLDVHYEMNCLHRTGRGR